MGPVSVGLDLNYTPSDICHGNTSPGLRKGTSFSYREGLSSREMYLILSIENIILLLSFMLLILCS